MRSGSRYLTLSKRSAEDLPINMSTAHVQRENTAATAAVTTAPILLLLYSVAHQRGLSGCPPPPQKIFSV